MLARRLQPKTLQFIVTLLSMGIVTSCSNSKAIENFVSADPQLQTEVKSENSPQDPAVTNPQTQNQQLPTQPQNQPTDSEVEIQPEPTTPTQTDLANLPQEIPSAIPFYPQAQLQQTEPESTTESGSFTLRSPDNLSAIAGYYQEQLQTQEWDIIQPFSLEQDGNSQSVIASKNNLKIKISLADSSVNNEDNDSQTEINIAYKPLSADLATANPESTSESENTPDITENSSSESENTPDITENSSDEPEVVADKTPVTNAVTNFSDLAEVREQLQQAVKEVAAVGILTPQNKDNPDKFAPNELITRRDYARWLVSANNKFHDNSPGNKIHLTKKTNQLAFKDIELDDPDFGAIQGLAEAGLISSILTSDSGNVLFRPDAPLTREDLITWKVPLDLRAALPKASIETIQETWGFQDAAKIDPLAIKALFSDYQNGDRSNVRRIFGYTTLFQPKKGVTRAEAAASLWYFGYQEDGISAEELLDSSIN